MHRLCGRPMNPKVSIIIVNFNGADLLRACLDSLEGAVPSETQIVVVDNASSDSSMEVLKSYSRVTLVKSVTNRGFAGGSNLGLKHCFGDYVLLLNTDTVVLPYFLEPLVNYLDGNRQVGIVQGKMLLSRHGGVLDVCGSFLTYFGFLYHYGYYKIVGACRRIPVQRKLLLLLRRDRFLPSRVGGRV